MSGLPAIDEAWEGGYNPGMTDQVLQDYSPTVQTNQALEQIERLDRDLVSWLCAL
jgi:hypothetical protein